MPLFALTGLYRLYAFYTDEFVLPLPDRHRFPMSKYSLLRERITQSRLVDEATLLPPAPATDEQLILAHSEDYVHRATTGNLSRKEVLRIGFPWSPQLIERSRRSVGATIEASFRSIDDGFAANLAGGTHHSFRDCGEGYCVFNDSVVAGRILRQRHLVRRVLVIDTDVHQGNGTASIVRDDDSIFTFSIHGAKNFPLRKEQSDLDVPLADNTQDDEFLAALDSGLSQAMESANPDLAFYLAGADPFEHDTLGRLSVSKAGLAERDRIIYSCCRRAGIPVVVSMAGGYAEDVHDTVDIHYHSIATGAMMLLGETQPSKIEAE